MNERQVGVQICKLAYLSVINLLHPPHSWGTCCSPPVLRCSLLMSILMSAADCSEMIRAVSRPCRAPLHTKAQINSSAPYEPTTVSSVQLRPNLTYLPTNLT